MNKYLAFAAAAMIADPAFALPAAVCNPLADAAEGAMDLRQQGVSKDTVMMGLGAILGDDSGGAELATMLVDAAYKMPVETTQSDKALSVAVFKGIARDVCMSN